MIHPPDEKAWPRERLFRLFLLSPRARLMLDYRHPLASDVQLWAVASPAQNLTAAAISGASQAGLSVLSFGTRLADIVAESLHDDDGPVFPSGRWMEHHMTGSEISTISTHLLSALAICQPELHRCDYEQWHMALLKGARHPSNNQHTMSLATCVSERGGHPEWFYGVKRCDLTDGQWMAFWAARDYWNTVEKRGRKS